MKFLSILMVFIFISLPSALLASDLGASEHGVSEYGDGTEGVLIKNPGSELWSNVRQREFPLLGTSQMKSTGADVLINISVESWRQYRMQELIPKASIALFLGLFGVFVFRLLRGKMILPDGRSGLKILRFRLNQRVAHLILLCLLLPQISVASEHEKYEGVLMINPGSELWRDIRQRENVLEGISQVEGVDTGILINSQGDRWARFRINELVSYGAIALAAIAVVLLLFYLIRGKVGVEGGLSGRMVHRFTDYERIVHWTLAVVFLFLAITGLILLLGRTFLIPVLGQEIFSLLASGSKEGHNLFGPIFIVSLLMMLFSFAKRNIYEKGDLTWLLKGGGLLGKSHVTGGFFNMGEKTWYWMVILVGLLISVTGLILVSPNFGQGRIIMELSHVIHVAGAVILVAVSIGHMYLGSIGSEASLEGMKTGYVDINWVAAHHDRWEKECRENNLIISAEDYAKLQGKTGSDSGELTPATMEQGK